MAKISDQVSVITGSVQALEEDAQDDREAGRLARDAEEGGDRRRRARVDVRHPHLERHDGHLEAEARRQHDRRQQQAGAHAFAVVGDGGRDAGLARRRHQSCRAGEAEEVGHAVEDDGGRDRAHQQVLDARLGRFLVPLHRGHDVLRDARQLQRHEDQDEVAAHCQQGHRTRREQHEGVELGLIGAEALHVVLRGQDHRGGNAGEEERKEEREVVQDDGVIEGEAGLVTREQRECPAGREQRTEEGERPSAPCRAPPGTACHGAGSPRTPSARRRPRGRERGRFGRGRPASLTLNPASCARRFR